MKVADALNKSRYVDPARAAEIVNARSSNRAVFRAWFKNAGFRVTSGLSARTLIVPRVGAGLMPVVAALGL